VALDVAERHTSSIAGYRSNRELLFQSFGLRYTDQHLNEPTCEEESNCRPLRMRKPDWKMHSVASTTDGMGPPPGWLRGY